MPKRFWNKYDPGRWEKQARSVPRTPDDICPVCAQPRYRGLPQEHTRCNQVIQERLDAEMRARTGKRPPTPPSPPTSSG